jgi:hypothetical protein
MRESVFPQGLKPGFIFAAFAAWLKPCPDTRLMPEIISRLFGVWLKPCPDTGPIPAIIFAPSAEFFCGLFGPGGKTSPG